MGEGTFLSAMRLLLVLLVLALLVGSLFGWAFILLDRRDDE